MANIDQKGFSERIVSAPVSPLGQRTRVNTKYATSVALPSTLALDPARVRIPENEEQPIDMFYAFVYVSDREEGLVGSNVATLVDGNPDNNFLKRDVTYNPDGALTGASFVTAAGHRLYMTTPRGLFVIDCTDPDESETRLGHTPRFPAQSESASPSSSVTPSSRMMRVLKIPRHHRSVLAGPIRGAVVRLRNPVGFMSRGLTLRREWSGGSAIIDVENPERPHSTKCSTPTASSTTRARCRSGA